MSKTRWPRQNHAKHLIHYGICWSVVALLAFLYWWLGIMEPVTAVCTGAYSPM